MALDILACPACGGQVPLADGDVIDCPFCRAKVELPPAHRELRDAERHDTAARTRARELFTLYGGKPSLLLRVCAILFHPIFLVLDGFFLILGTTMVVFLFIGTALGPLLHDNLWDTLNDAVKGYGMFFLAGGTLLSGIALGVYGRRKIMSTRGLQAALAARPPERPGESARCRECGAPLFVRGGDEGARCPYCHTDNLVNVPRDWIEGITADRARIGSEIEHADAWLQEEHKRIRRSLKIQLGISGGILFAFISLIAIGNPKADWRGSWDVYVKNQQLARVTSVGIPANKMARDCVPEPIYITAEECAGETCTVWLYAPLRSGEHFSLGALPAGTQLRVVMHSHFWWGRDLHEGFGREIPVENGVSFTAPWSAWYQLRLILPKGPSQLCAMVR